MAATAVAAALDIDIAALVAFPTARLLAAHLATLHEAEFAMERSMRPALPRVTPSAAPTAVAHRVLRVPPTNAAEPALIPAAPFLEGWSGGSSKACTRRIDDIKCNKSSCGGGGGNASCSEGKHVWLLQSCGALLLLFSESTQGWAATDASCQSNRLANESAAKHVRNPARTAPAVPSETAAAGQSADELEQTKRVQEACDATTSPNKALLQSPAVIVPEEEGADRMRARSVIHSNAVSSIESRRTMGDITASNTRSSSSSSGRKTECSAGSRGWRVAMKDCVESSPAVVATQAAMEGRTSGGPHLSLPCP